jgi:uncharacterized protein YunC (DUF1805 family)
MEEERIILAHKEMTGYVISLGPVNLVFVVSDKGMVGCGAFDVNALDRFRYPAARARTHEGVPIVTLHDLMEGIIRDTNTEASERGIREGMSVRDALTRL